MTQPATTRPKRRHSQKAAIEASLTTQASPGRRSPLRLFGESAPDAASTRDAPGTDPARYAPIAVDDDVVVATGISSYSERPGGRGSGCLS
jgi:hypothetical protein